MELSPRAINDMSDRAYHHHDSTKAASTFMLDAPPNDSVVQGSSGFVSQQTNHNTVSQNLGNLDKVHHALFLPQRL